MFKIFKVAVAGVIAATFVLGGTAVAYADTPNTTITNESPVIDTADMFTPEQEATIFAAMEDTFVAYDLAVVLETVPSLNGAPIEEVSLTEANRLGVGEAEKNNGVFILLSRDDREIRFELGSGVTGTVSDAEAKIVIDTVAIPSFKNGDYVTGVVNSMGTLGNYYVGELDYVEPVVVPYDWSGFWFIVSLVLGAVALIGAGFGVVAIVLNIRRRKADKVKAEFEAAVALQDRERREFVRQFHSKLAKTDFELLPTSYDRNEYLKSLPEFQERTLADPDYNYLTMIMRSLAYDFQVGSQESLKSARMRHQKEEEAENRRRKEERRRAEEARVEALNRKNAAKKLWDSMSASEKSNFKKVRSATERTRSLAQSSNYGYESSILYPYIMMMYFSNVSASLGNTSSISRMEDAAHEATRAAEQAAASYSRSHSSSSSSSSYSSSDYSSSSSFGGGSFGGDGSSGSW